MCLSFPVDSKFGTSYCSLAVSIQIPLVRQVTCALLYTADQQTQHGVTLICQSKLLEVETTRPLHTHKCLGFVFFYGHVPIISLNIFTIDLMPLLWWMWPLDIHWNIFINLIFLDKKFKSCRYFTNSTHIHLLSTVIRLLLTCCTGGAHIEGLWATFKVL